MWILLLNAALAAECPEPATTITLGATLDQAESSYGDLDLDGFDEALGAIRAQIPCLQEVVPSPLVASLHRFEGLKAFLDGAPDRSQRAFAAARSIEPAYRFPRSVVPEGNPVLDDYAAMDPATQESSTAPTPAAGALRIDGQLTQERSTSFPVLFQRVDGGGAVAESAYLWPSMPLPTYEVAPEVSDADRSRRAARVALFSAAGAAAITSGVMYGMAAAQHARFDSADTAYADLDDARRATNTLAAGSGVAAVVAAGAGIGGVLVGRF